MITRERYVYIYTYGKILGGPDFFLCVQILKILTVSDKTIHRAFKNS